MNKLTLLIGHHWPDARKGLDYEIATQEDGQEFISAWSDSMGPIPTAEEVANWDPAKPEVTTREVLSLSAMREKLGRGGPTKEVRTSWQERLKNPQGKTASTQLEEVRAVLIELVNAMPG